jgi:cytochrome c oxidase subunit 3
MAETQMSTRTIVKASEGDKVISSVAMIVALVSFGMLFLTLMLGFALFRFTAPVWPPAGMEKPSLLLPLISTILIAASSFTYNVFEKEVHNGNTDRKFLSVTLILGLAFMISQIFFWNQLTTQGILVSSGIYASIIYSFTWIHAAHIVAALALLLWLFSVLNKNEKRTAVKVSNVGKFWHFLGIVWLIMFVTIFVL